jgi:hypothetical protein
MVQFGCVKITVLNDTKMTTNFIGVIDTRNVCFTGVIDIGNACFDTSETIV